MNRQIYCHIIGLLITQIELIYYKAFMISLNC